MFDAIIFDKDGTLFDFQATWSALAEALLDTLSKGDGALRRHLGSIIGFESGVGFLPSSVMIAGTTEECAAILSNSVDQSIAEIEDLLNRLGEDTAQVAVPHLNATIETLRDFHVLGVVTNDSEAPARAHLASVQIAQHFAFVAGYDSGFGSKPEPGQLLAFCQATGTAPDRTAMVGDSLHDLHAGRAAGMATIGVLTGVAEAAELAGHADVVLPDISHIPDWIAAQRRA